MTTLLYLSTKRTNKKTQKAPIWFRVELNGQRIERSTGIYIYPKDWNRDTKRIKGGEKGCDLAAEYNAKLVALEGDAQIKLLTAESGRMKLPPSAFRKPKQEKVITILHAAKSWNQENSAELGGHASSTSKTLKVKLTALADFLKAKYSINAPISELNAQLAKNYKNYLLEEKKLSPAYVSRCLQTIKGAEKWCVSEGLKEGLSMSVVGFKKLPRSKARWLNEKQYAAVVKEEGFYRDIFVLQCEVGFSHCDMNRISPDLKVIHNDIICIAQPRRKTDIGAIVPLTPLAYEILQKYNWQIPKNCLQVMNRELKELARRAKIPVRLSTHVGRHTFGMNALNNGYTLESVSRMMGHKSIKTTEEIYAKVLPKRIVTETLLLNRPIVYHVAA